MSDKMHTVNFAEKFATFKEYWTPKIIGELNGQYLKIAKFKGEFIWHSHKNEDEFFQVVKGKIQIHLRDKVVNISEGEFYIVPKGVEHKPVANEEAHVLMFEPKGTDQTGGIESDLRVNIIDQSII
jgi:mannose-6-phosphate isomerase-like protein (cupin superfamily)